jgi:peptide deformylase
MSKIILYPNEILNKESTVIDNFNEDVIKLFNELEQAMKLEGGLGISAVQIGVLSRAMIITEENGTLVKICNPETVNDPNCPQKYLKESCLSIPGIQVPIWRSEDIEVKFKTETGEDKHMAFNEWTARCFLHELDHLNGKTVFDHISSIQKSEVLRKYKIARRKLRL